MAQVITTTHGMVIIIMQDHIHGASICITIHGQVGASALITTTVGSIWASAITVTIHGVDIMVDGGDHPFTDPLIAGILIAEDITQDITEVIMAAEVETL